MIIIGLSVGIFFMRITTDPVELWAAPHSRSRIEKDFFDETFGPFYRTAQVFIKPHNSEYVRKHFFFQLNSSIYFTITWEQNCSLHMILLAVS